MLVPFSRQGTRSLVQAFPPVVSEAPHRTRVELEHRTLDATATAARVSAAAPAAGLCT